MIGSKIDNYKIISLLGEGGMGIVYKAFDLKLERYAALKILSSQATNNPQFIQRFKREAKHQASLTHPNIVPVYGFVEFRGVLGIAMEYVEGETLEILIQRRGRLLLPESLFILKQILSGVSYAHKKGFVHRDIKPSNIILDHEGSVKIMDFGISKSLNELHGITKTGTKIGTILYMSPEQIKAQEPTAQSDLYSIGITFYEMLAGKTPFDEGTEYEIMEAHLKKNPPKLSATYTNIDSDADKIIQKALAKNLTKRYATCEEFLTDVNDLIEKIEDKKKKKKKLLTRLSAVTEKEKKPVVEKIRLPDDNSIKGKKEKARFFIFAFLVIIISLSLFVYFYKTIQNYWFKAMDSDKGKTTEVVGLEQPTQKVILDKLRKLKPITLETNNSLSSIYFINDSTGFACGNSGTILKTTTFGSSWSLMQDSSFGNLNSIYFPSPYKGFAAGDNGTIVVTYDQGETWIRQSTGFSNTFFKIYFADENTGFIIGSSGIILKTVNGGEIWNALLSPTTKVLFDIFVNKNKNEVYIVGWEGELLKSTDMGETWFIHKQITEKYLRSVYFINDENGFAVGGGGVILNTDDGGENWDLVISNTYSGLFKIDFFNSEEGIILGAKGEILYTEDGGKVWQKIPETTYYSLTDVCQTKLGEMFITGYNGILLNNL